MLVLWLGTWALAASPQLHRLLHEDAANPSHYCVFTQVSQQAVFTSLTTAAAPQPPVWTISATRFTSSPQIPSFDYTVSLGRAPPAQSLPKMAAG